jgi:NAD(P)-dependent dehydrogenase (short-subunit alcohol dehydrogenase family)
MEFMAEILKNAPIALITGAAKRLGRAIALGLAQAGWDVAVHYRSSSVQAEETAEAVRALGRRACVFEADLADEQQVQQLWVRCITALGVPCCIVNNASLFEYDAPNTFSYAALDVHMKTNVAAGLTLAREMALALRVDDRRGVVVNLLDQKLAGYNPDFFSYTLSKAALQAATVMMAQQFAPYVRVMGVAPGLTLPSYLQDEQAFERTHRLSLTGASSQPEQVVDAVLFCINNPALTGSWIYVDAGQHLLGLQRDVSFL